ncbi:hypothetical protein BDW59DRAFT_174184 [Aspergillus cavernicola]|uniref:Zn(2)-C6 fungal-type domain-containing protein n=1 Tax=Aspergillus cavernicola TaxID=176166 RepID=A0ABR4I0P7_9EURO
MPAGLSDNNLPRSDLVQSEGDSSSCEQKRKAPRLSHRKSRNGCQRCRIRRVKCDESRPVCRDCYRHGVPCFYDRSEGDASHQDQVPLRAQPLPKWIPRGPPILSESTRDEHTELRLLHHFTIGTSSTMPGTHLQSIKHCWSVDVPRLAFGYKPLLHALFAISALHMAKSEPSEPGLLSIHRVHLEQALREHRLSVGGINTQIADATCFTSILLLVDVFATLQDRPVDPYEPPFEWMHLVRGSVSVFDAALNTIRDTRSAKIWSIIETFPSPTPGISSLGTRDLKYFSCLLPMVAPDEEEENDEAWNRAAEAYTETIAYINATWLAMQANEYPQITSRRLMVFPLFVPLEFIRLLQEKRPRALVILAHFLALSAPLSHMWWIGHTAHKDVLAIQDMLDPQWATLMTWPVDVVTSRCWICANAQA